MFKVFIFIRGLDYCTVSEGNVSEFSEQLGTSIFGVEMSKDRLVTSFRLVRGRRG